MPRKMTAEAKRRACLIHYMHSEQRMTYHAISQRLGLSCARVRELSKRAPRIIATEYAELSDAITALRDLWLAKRPRTRLVIFSGLPGRMRYGMDRAMKKYPRRGRPRKRDSLQQ